MTSRFVSWDNGMFVIFGKEGAADPANYAAIEGTLTFVSDGKQVCGAYREGPLALPTITPDRPTDMVECPQCDGGGSFEMWTQEEGVVLVDCELCGGAGVVPLVEAVEHTYQMGALAYEIGRVPTRPERILTV